MREIKFRYWNKEDNEMINGDALAFEEYLPIADHLNQEGIMQYTGMKDVNNVEIYEGDIVTYKMRNLSQAFGDADAPAYIEYKRLIEFYNYGFTVPQGFVKEIEVIGNIHENPELIK